MDIVVCVKRVPATDSKIKVGADGKSIDPAGIEFVLNPYDEFAVEEAIKTREALGSGSVTVITLGTGDSQKELRTCLAMGADKAVLLDASGLPGGGASLDACATARIVADHVKGIPHDAVFCGRQAVDGDDSQFPSRLAALLDLPCVTEVAKLELSDGRYRAERDIEGAREVVDCPTPCVISTNKGLNEPRYANLKGIMAAKKKPLEESAADLPAAAMEIVSLELPAPRAAGRIIGNGADAVPALIDALRNEAKAI